MADKTKQALRVENNQSFPDNNTGFITPDKLRTFQENMIDSFVNNEDSGSLTFDTGSLLTTASATDATIQFTKGDGSTFDVTLTVQADSSSLVTTSSFNEYTQSTDDRLTNIELETASLDGRVSSIELETASLETKFDTLENTTSSLQNFTQSADVRLGELETFTQSQETKNTTLENTTSSLQNFTSSADNRLTNIETFTQSAEGRLDNIELTTQSLEEKNNTLETFTQSLYQTASNDFSEITLTKVDGSTQVLDTTPRQVVESVKNGNGQQLPKGTPVYASGSVGNAQLVFPASASDDTTMPAVYILAQTLDPDEEGLGYTHGFINGVNTSLFNAGDEIYVGVNGGYTNQPPTGSTNLIQKLGTVVRSDVSNGSGVIQIDSIRGLPNIQEGYLWVGDSDGVPQQIATSSIEENTDLSSLNSFTQSQEDLNGTFATTGSNTFTDNQVVSGSITISEGNDLNFGYNTNGMALTSFDNLDQPFSGYDTSFGIINKGLNNNQSSVKSSIAIGAFSLGGQQAQSGSLIDQTLALGTQALTRFEAGLRNTAIGGNLAMAYLSTGSNNTAIGAFALQALGFGTGTESHERNTGIGTAAGNGAAAGGFFTGGFGNTFIGANSSPLNGTTNYETVIGAFAEGHGENTTTIGSINKTQETYILGDTFISGNNDPGLGISSSGDLDIQGTFTSSLTEGYVLVGDSNNRTYEVSTGSFGGGGGFPYEGDAQISGSLGVTGSFSGDVVTLTAVSSTASINMNDGNFFTLNIPTGTTTHIDFTNIRPGQVINLQTTQPATTGSLEFSPSVKFAGGYPFIATTTGSAIDFITFVSLDGTNVLGTGIKNFL